MARAEAVVACLVRQADSEVGGDGELLLEVCEEGLNLLREDVGSELVSCIAVAGMYRTGKSFFLNQLAGSGGGKQLGVGSTTEPHTRGIWLWSAQWLRASDGSRLVLMDTEGLASADQDESYDVKIFALGLLLSSYFVLNVVGVIDDATIERLHLVTEVSKRIVIHSGEGHETKDDLASHFPPLLVLVRDFALAPTAQGKEISDREYLEEALRARGDAEADPKRKKRHERRDKIRTSLRALFPLRACATLVRPASDEATLREAAHVPDEMLRGEFVEKMLALRAAIIDGTDSSIAPAATAKRIMGRTCTGAALAEVARHHVAAINAGAAPSIAGAWDAATRELCASAYEASMRAYMTGLRKPPDAPREPARGLPDDGSWDSLVEVDERHRDAACGALAIFDREAVDSDTKEKLRRKLVDELERRRTELLDDIQVRSEAACSAALDELRRTAKVMALDANERSVLQSSMEGFRSGALVQLRSLARGPARAYIYERLLNEVVMVPLLLEPAAAELKRSVYGPQLAEIRERAAQELDAAHRRAAAAEQRADERAERVDKAERRSTELAEQLNATRDQLADSRRRTSSLEANLDVSEARAAVDRAQAAMGMTLQAQEGEARLQQLRCNASRLARANDALQSGSLAFAAAGRAASAAQFASSACSKMGHTIDAIAVSTVVANLVSKVNAAADAEKADERHVRDLAVVAAKVRDETMRSTLDEAAFLASKQQPIATSTFAPIGKLWSVGRQKVASVAEHVLQQIDDELASSQLSD